MTKTIHLSRDAPVPLPGCRVTSRYKGVTWNSVAGKWLAVIWDHEAKKTHQIGYFDTEDQVSPTLFSLRARAGEAMQRLGSCFELPVPLHEIHAPWTIKRSTNQLNQFQTVQTRSITF